MVIIAGVLDTYATQGVPPTHARSRSGSHILAKTIPGIVVYADIRVRVHAPELASILRKISLDHYHFTCFVDCPTHLGELLRGGEQPGNGIAANGQGLQESGS